MSFKAEVRTSTRSMKTKRPDRRTTTGYRYQHSVVILYEVAVNGTVIREAHHNKVAAHAFADGFNKALEITEQEAR